MRLDRIGFVLTLAGALGISSVNSQTAGTQNSPKNATPVFRVTSRLVQVDVLATDKSGMAIRDLKQSDFVVMQDGEPQEVRVFEAHAGSTPKAPREASRAAAMEALRGTYNNIPENTAGDARTIVVYDMLNTSLEAQAYARAELLRFLKTQRTGTPTALVVLKQTAQIVQGFTTEQKELVEKAEKIKPERSLVLNSTGDRQTFVGTVTYADAMLGRNPAGPRAGQAYEDAEAFRIGGRTYLTLNAFNAIARAVAAYPGRKNLIWLSGSFPIDIERARNPEKNVSGGDQERYDPAWKVRVLLGSVEDTGKLLASARIAVYPIDVRGLRTIGPDASVGVGDITPYRGTEQAAQLHNDIVNVGNERTTMKQLAKETGGRAYVGVNDAAESIRRAMEESSVYYTLSYAPKTIDDSAKYHHIEVRVNRPDVNLNYRQGYYYTPPKVNAGESAIALRSALLPGVPDSTMLLFAASGKYNKGKGTLRIEYTILPQNVTFREEAKGGRHVVVDLMAIAFDESGKEAAHASNTLDGVIPEEKYQNLLKSALPAEQELSLKPGKYYLRLGVIDRVSQDVGTLQVPVEVR
jgi:VWFA-related protein